MNRAWIVPTLLVGLLFSAQAVHAAPFTFQGLGVPDGYFTSEAYGVSGDGKVVIGTSMGGTGFQAIRWTEAGGMVGLGDLPGEVTPGIDQSGFARATSFDGSVVVGYGSTNAGREGFRWTQAGGMIAIGDLSGSPFQSKAFGVTGDGGTIVGKGNIDLNDFGLAFRGTPGSLSSLGDFSGGITDSGAYAVSADGSVIVGYGNAGPGLGIAPQPAYWTSSEPFPHTLSGVPATVRGEALGVSADGQVIVGYVTIDSNEHAFRWTDDGYQDLGLLPGDVDEIFNFYRATAASADGSVIVGDENQAAWIWRQDHGIIDLKSYLLAGGAGTVAGWQLSHVTGVSADGRTFVGYGQEPGVGARAWIATIPEPSSLVLAGLSAAGLIFVALRRRRCH